MSSVQIPLNREHLRTNLGGGICPTCRWAADHRQPHDCITHPDTGEYLALTPPTTETRIQLAAHPADPLGHSSNRGFQPADRSWCSCQCTPTTQPGGVRS